MDEAVIDKIVARVLAQLSGEQVCTAPRRVLMLFCGARTGAATGLEAVRRLSASGHILSVMLTQAASAIVGDEAVRKAGAVNIVMDDPRVDVAGLACGADLILIPTLTTRMAGYLSLGLMESPVATLILRALLAGKPVLAIRDGADPNGHVAREIYGAVPGASPALRARLEASLSTLASYGIELVSENDFLLRLEQRLIVRAAPGERPAGEDIAEAAAYARPLPVRPGAGREIVTAGDLLRCGEDQRVRLAVGSRLTPQAEDVARQMRLEIEFV